MEINTVILIFLQFWIYKIRLRFHFNEELVLAILHSFAN